MSDYSGESGEYSSEEIEVSDDENSDSGGSEEADQQSESNDGASVDKRQNFPNDQEPKLTDIIKTQQIIIENLKKELASMKLQIPQFGIVENRKYALKSEESTSAVVSSFDDDDVELDSLLSEGSIGHHEASLHGPYVTNPLFVDVVIQKVMDHLPLKSLLVSRFVCRKWNAVATPQIANKCGLIFLEVHQPWKPSKGIKVSTFIDVMRNSLSCPFSKFSISSFVALEELDRFFFHYGRNVKHLDLNFPEDFDDSREFAMLLSRKIRHIESLRIGCCLMFKQCRLLARTNDLTERFSMEKCVLPNLKTFCIGNIVNMMPNKAWLEDFFKMTPNLEKLVLHVNFKENGNTFIRIVLESLMNLDVLRSIKTLMISCLTESHLRTLVKLAECGLRLRNFKFQDLCLHLTEINGTTLETFLYSQAEYLESLEIEQSSNFPRIRHFQLPVLKSLKTLSIISSQRISFGSINYMSLLPKLDKLTLRGFDVFICASIFPHSDHMPKRLINGHCLRVLSLPSKFSVPHFPKILSQTFPNLLELEVRGVANECLREIWESWPRLEKIKIVVSHFDDNIDSGLTGIPEELCRELRSDLRPLEERQLKQLKSAPAITDLQSLRSLEVECRAMWIPCQLITDVSGYFALAHLTNLRNLKVTEIGVPEKFDLSNECIVVIMNTLKDLDASFKIMDDHGRWQQELGRIDLLRNTYESEPQLEDHNKDKEFIID